MNNELPPDVQKQVKQWLVPPFDQKTISQVQHLLNHDPQTLINLFYTTLSFGTGGMRGVMDIGINRMNRYTIRAATQGLSHYILKQTLKKKPRVFIGYDSRKNSRLFAQETARVLAANGIEAHLTKELRPTPYVSFGCRYLKCTAAVMITASHNPPEYNGYKVYWSDGAQIVAPQDRGIIEEVKKIKTQEQVKLVNLDHPFIHEVGQEIDEAYFQAITPLQNYPKENQKSGKNLHLVYSSLHGTGITLLPEALKRWGFINLSLVQKQTTPDSSFPYAHTPNPEHPETLQLGNKILLKEKADLFFATDPDADRIGVVVNHKDQAIILSGNQLATLLIFYLCTTLTKLGKMPKNGAVVTTIVTTQLFNLIASTFNLSCFQVLTGFKYIGEKIHQWENGSFSFLFGAEESLGYLYGTHARDKDAITAACLISEMALQEKLKGKTLIDLLHEIYHQFGFFHEKQLSISFASSKQEAEKIEKMMTNLREHPPKQIDGHPVVTLEDYQTKIKLSLPSMEKAPLTLPQSNVLVFILKDQTKLIIRPSGTEPKIKIYGMIHQKLNNSIDETKHLCDNRLNQILNTFKNTYFS